MKLRPTPMGMLEVLMWTGAAGAVVTFWLLWPGQTDKPAPKRIAVERSTSPALVFSQTADRELDSPGFREWRERFQEAKGASELLARLKERSGSDWPTVTGSSSLVVPAPPALSGGTVTPVSEATESAVPRADGSAAPPVAAALAEPQSEHIDPDAAAASRPAVAQDVEPSPEVHSEISETLEAGTIAANAEPAYPPMTLAEPQIDPPVEPPSLNMAGLPEIDVTPDITASLITDFARAAVDTAGETLVASEADPPPVSVPDVEIVLADLGPAVAAEQPSQSEPPSGSTSATRQVGRDALVLRGEEMLERGDVSGARLLFQRAAESGDARAAIGLARTYDSKVLRTLRVYGVRPDPDQAAHWYARSKALENMASVR